MSLESDLFNLTQFVNPNITVSGMLERIYGVDITVTNTVKAQTNTTNNTFRNVMWVKGHSLGLGSARDLEMEASSRNEVQQVIITGIHRVAGAVLD